jgi:hypothetical protein
VSLVLLFRLVIHHDHPGFDEHDDLFLTLGLGRLVLLLALT